ncbi:restriction endonuclease subunit S [Coraliomargarita sp. SDUM461003]|uniref:Restriction endonuclease subunit S n=1 Tax=Thalassobacterium maritimum TaxID=3041265 RepID=A0ABU1AP42_9BACT|nr:restriction endonuclease subunit S [Coraliomargarita sp. SDUM461003]MDQ8205936.1 restriction endonuclease subunit S [Coraliomargarita sp. SDUM461003]
MAQELYELPQGWEWKTLQELGKFSAGGTPSKSNPDFWGGDQLWITPKDMKSEKLRDSQLKITDTAIDKSSAKLIPAGSILIVARSGILRHTLPVCINEIEATVNQDIKVFIPSKKITSAFCQKMLIGHEPMILRDLVKGGVTVESLKYQEFQNHPFPVPPLAEQERIVAKLDALFSRIDQAIAQLQHTQAQTKALLNSGSKHSFDELSKRHGSSKLSSVVKINSGIALPKIFKNWEGTGDLPFYKVAQMNNDTRIMRNPEITFSSNIGLKNRIKLFPAGSVLIPKRGGAILTNKKRLLLEEASYDSNIMGLKADESILTDEYLFQFMLSLDLSDFIDTSTIPQINNKHIDRMQIPVPPLAEQSKIVAQLDAISERTQALTAATSAQLEKLGALKASLLDAAFRGQL